MRPAVAGSDQLLLEQLPQVKYIARRIHERLPQHVPFDDLLHAGIVGLIDAMHKYDASKNVRFASYAKFRIRGRDSRQPARHGLESARSAPQGAPPGNDHAEAANRAGPLGHASPSWPQAMGMTLEEFQHMLDEIRGLEVGSLQIESLEDGRETDLGETIPGPADQDPLSLCMQGERKQMLADAIAGLPEREQQVLALYYQEELTMKEVGAVLGVGESRVSQIHSVAVAALARRSFRMRTDPCRASASRPAAMRKRAGGSMEKVLSQGEIDALFRAAQGDAAPCGRAPRRALVEPWDLHQAGLLGKEQLHSISQLHESFARNLTSAVGGYLRDKFEVALVAVEQLAYRDFLARFRRRDLLQHLPAAARRGQRHPAHRLEPGLSHGGPASGRTGTDAAGDARGDRDRGERTGGVGQVICHELQLVWEPLGLQVEFERRQPVAQMLRIMPPQEKTLTLTFDVTMTDSKGMMNIAFPSVVSSALMRKLRTELVYQRARGPAVNQESIGKRLLESASSSSWRRRRFPCA